ncbi:flagellar biosynthesis protein FlhF [Thiovibrio sp. JS02]
MRIKRFEAADTYSAMAMVKEELGENAVILSTRTLKEHGGAKRGRPRVEVVAAMEYDQEPLIVPPPEEEPKAEEACSPRAANSGYGYHTLRAPQQKSEKKEDQFARSLSAKIASQAGTEDKIHFEANDLRARFASFLRRQYCARTEIDGRAHEPAIGDTGKKGARPDPKQVAQWRDKIIDQLRIIPLRVEKQGGPNVVALVGPTGVGKTTTAAKIAAWYSIHEGLRVALLSMDCYRIGATDQLRTYAKIMRLPCEIALRKRDLESALLRHQDKDLIIIDTAGKSPYDPGHIKELAEWFAAIPGLAAYLVLSATYKKEDLQHILKTYDPLRVNGLALTKLDETRAYAALCQQLASSPLPISCLCTGQRVPEDFLLASKEFLQTLFGQGWQAATTELAAESLGRWTQ